MSADHALSLDARPAAALHGRTLGLVVAAGTLLLALPALVNGFPFLFHDTGGYLAPVMERWVVPGRSTAYSLLLVAGRSTGFWLTALVQCALAAWLIALTARAEGLSRRPLAVLALYGVLAAFTGLPFVAAELIPDIFAAVGPLALYLILWRRRTLSTAETAGALAVVAFAAASHNSVLAVEAVMVFAGLLAALIWPPLRAILGARAVLLAVALGGLLTPAVNLAVAGNFTTTPGGTAFVFGRLLEDGIVERYLKEHCPDTGLVLCDHRADLPDTANDFLWDDNDTFNAIGGFDHGGAAMQPVIFGLLYAYPLENLGLAVEATGRQLVTLKTGDEMIAGLGHTHEMIGKYAPDAVPAMAAALQQGPTDLDFSALNRLHQPVAIAATLLVAGLGVAAAFRRRLHAAVFAGTIAVILLANAAICGVLSNPVDRYQGRVAWLAVLAVSIVALNGAAASRRRSPGTP